MTDGRPPPVPSAAGPVSRLRRGGPFPVLINGRFLTQRLEGVQRTAEQVVRALDTLVAEGAIDPARWSLRVLAPRTRLRDAGLRHIPVEQVGRLAGHAWEQFELPWHARGGLLLNLCNTAPLLKRRQLATMYDAAVFSAPAAYSRAFVVWYRALFAAVGRIAHTVITVSEFSRRELTSHARIPRSRLTVVPLGAEHLDAVGVDESILDRWGLRGARYILAVGSENPNKNFPVVLEALEALPEPRPILVVAGGANERVFRGADREAPTARVVRVGYVSDAQLKALYRAASAFVFPSLYEGFGLPPLEAMKCGCPVAASDIPVLREVCGDAAAFFIPNDPADLARVVGRVLDDRGYAARLRVAGTARAAEFTWRDCASRIWMELESAAVGAS